MTVRERLAAVEARMDDACRRSGRSRAEVTLVAVGKTHPAATLRAAYDAGQRVFGENRVQEALAKAAELPADVDWHLIGPLQSNKVRAAARLFGTVHSVDRPKIARLLSREAETLGRRLPVFLEVRLGDEDNKHGLAPVELDAVAAQIVALPALDLVGLMAIPPFEEEPAAARAWFRRLRELRDALAPQLGPGFPGCLSMGMSHDFEIAIEEGATHVRVGTDVFGPRPSAGEPP